ncbi:unnamed protein product [Acanthoscelides obtectus]|uniref:Hexosyltransferase n=1 Tax=Acanthoscelides obtectus TaxID=200917 RepID=A0A9P0K2G3_ACAOB|nr:unnamed protein product [Acanthoscelides obtectus]CAK1632549.1 Beta-1,3-galactosyltransferase brn [Acanthoscelides obtectus]
MPKSSSNILAMKLLRRNSLKNLLLLFTLVFILYIFGVFHHLFETNFYDEFHYPYDGDIEVFVEKLKHNITPDVKPINMYNYNFDKNPSFKCFNIENLRLVFLVKSSPENFDQRIAIRSTWGFERRFSDVEIRTVFLLGQKNNMILQQSVDEESRRFSDIVQGNFTDSYYNNTFKTMMGLEWASKYCSKASFYMIVDDDYYVSTKNVLRFIRYPSNYPDYLIHPMTNIQILLKQRHIQQLDDLELPDDARLYAGYVFNSSPHRHMTSKWYVSLTEYPYHMWPPYVTGGATLFSQIALIDMYYASFYTKHFRFDDIYVGLLAYKTKIEPCHCSEFFFYNKAYNKLNYQYTVASHGFKDPKELIHVWTEQKSLGNA